MTRASGGSRVASGRAGGRPGQLRIIGGRLRGRRLPVPAEPGLRPTTDRVRETLFNWLAPDIAGSRCLDCFAGSGALGFEAYSRGAAHVVLVERAAGVAARLEANAAILRAAAGGPDGRLDVIRADALGWLSRTEPTPFDIAFLDPPFQQPLIGAACTLLQQGWLAPGAMVYMETPVNAPMPALPAGWEVVRERTAGQVRYALVRAGVA